MRVPIMWMKNLINFHISRKRWSDWVILKKMRSIKEMYLWDILRSRTKSFQGNGSRYGRVKIVGSRQIWPELLIPTINGVKGVHSSKLPTLMEQLNHYLYCHYFWMNFGSSLTNCKHFMPKSKDINRCDCFKGSVNTILLSICRYSLNPAIPSYINVTLVYIKCRSK